MESAKLIGQRTTVPTSFRDPETNLILRYTDYDEEEPRTLEVLDSQYADVIRVPEDCRTIEEQAFANSGASVIWIPNGVEAIVDNAFAGCEIFVICEEDSYAAQWCEMNGVDYAVQRE